MIQRLRLEFVWLKLSYRFKFAHHPTCTPYSNQVFRVLGIHLCQGCTMIYLGIIMGFLTQLLLQILFSPVTFLVTTIVTVGIVLILDTQTSIRLVKRTLRFSMGLYAGCIAASVIIDPNWIMKIVFAVVIILLFQAYRFFRMMRPSKDLCQTCPDFPKAPYCPGLIMQMEANSKYQDLVLPMVEANIASKLGVDIEQDEEKDIKIVWT